VSITAGQAVLAAAIGMMALGLYALLTTRHLVRILLALQILAKGALLALAAGGWLAGRAEVAQALIVTVIVADTVITTVGLALAVRVRRRLGTLDLADLATLKG
jgi:NADH-quinone oxidoreductase subunit K/multicomponent Na+:H+ antiporter subunit C